MHQLPRKVTQSMNLSQSKYSLSEVCKIERLTENTPAQNVPVFYEARAFFTK